MDHEDLIRLLDLSGKVIRNDEESVLLRTGEGQADTPRGATALVLDEWALRRGRDLLAASQRLQALNLDPDAAADFHGCAFEPDPRAASTRAGGGSSRRCSGRRTTGPCTR